MERIVMNCITPFLPHEIIRNILKRLPVKSLIRFQCVSKEWKNLIKAPSFIKDHLHHYSNQNPSLLLLLPDETDCHLHFVLLDSQMQISEVQNPPSMDSLLGADFIGSTNGLICLQIDRYNASSPHFLLWNPSIREVRSVPAPMYGGNGFGHCDYGFGFCPIANDYKIVITSARSSRGVNRVEVYSLSTGSWKKIEFENLELEGLSLASETDVSLDGAIHFHGTKDGGEDSIDVLVSFDLALETFDVMPWPTLECNCFRMLTVYDNKVAMICRNVNVTGELKSSFVDLLVMEEVTGSSGERWSWTKKFRTRSCPYILHPMTTWRNEIVCRFDVWETEEGNEKPRAFICRFNVSTDESATHDISYSHFIYNYVESLVPVCNVHV